jgi:hypothetical protein
VTTGPTRRWLTPENGKTIATGANHSEWAALIRRLNYRALSSDLSVRQRWWTEHVGSRGDARMLSEDQLAASIGHKFDGARAVNPTVIDDFRFLEAWERGLLASLSALLRARQIRRANAARAVRPTMLEQFPT